METDDDGEKKTDRTYADCALSDVSADADSGYAQIPAPERVRCEHFVSNEEDAIKYIASEAQNTGENIAGKTTELCAEQGGRTEPLDGDFCRVHLSWIKAGLEPKTLGRLFVISAEPAENGKEVLEEKVAVFQELVKHLLHMHGENF